MPRMHTHTGCLPHAGHDHGNAGQHPVVGQPERRRRPGAQGQRLLGPRPQLRRRHAVACAGVRVVSLPVIAVSVPVSRCLGALADVVAFSVPVTLVEPVASYGAEPRSQPLALPQPLAIALSVTIAKPVAVAVTRLLTGAPKSA